MDSEFGSQNVIIKDENAGRDERIKKGTYVVASLIMIGTFIGHAVTIALGVPMMRHCYYVAVVVMIIGSVLGFLQQIPEFFRNFIKLKPGNMVFVNYFFGLIVILRIIWLITATALLVHTECENITPAWICMSINWGILGLILIIISVVSVVKYFMKRNHQS